MLKGLALVTLAGTFLAPDLFGIEVRMPLDDNSGIRLGQGFDADTMEWRETCVTGARLSASRRTATIEALDLSSSSSDLDVLNGTFTAGINLLGGFAGAKAKANVFKRWMESDRSYSTAYHLDFGTQRVQLKNMKSGYPIEDRIAFKKKCGTHLVFAVESNHELFFFAKYLSNNTDWLEKSRIEVKVKAAAGLVKKKWSKEEIDEGSLASAQMNVGIQSSGIFQDYFSQLGILGGTTNVACEFPNLNRCNLLSETFHNSLEWVKESANSGLNSVESFDPERSPTAAILIPYGEAGPAFAAIFSNSVHLEKFYALNRRKRRINQRMDPVPA